MDVKAGLFLPPFGDLAHPRVLAELAAEAEQAGWDGFFLWDHINYRAPVTEVGDPWVALAAIATVTTRIRLGALVTPLARRRPQVVARQATSLDQLSDGRLVFGAGLGRDTSGRELSAFGEELDDRQRAQMLDEALEVIAALWSGESVTHDGPNYLVDDMAFLPTPVQRPRIPVWIGGRGVKRNPIRRACRWDGYFPVDVDLPEVFAACVEAVRTERGDLTGFDLIAETAPEADPAPWIAAGATWWLASFGIERASVTTVRAVAGAGPPSR